MKKATRALSLTLAILTALALIAIMLYAVIPQIIERLNKNNVKATFFTVGDWVTKNPEAVKKLSEAGMEIRQSYFKSCACGRDVI